MIRQLRNAQIIISMIGKQRAMRTFVTVQNMTFGTLPLIFEQLLASRFLFGQLIISFFIRIILGCKGIDFPGCLISGNASVTWANKESACSVSPYICTIRL